MFQTLQEKLDLSMLGTIANVAGMILLGVASAFKNRADSIRLSRARKAKAIARKFNILFGLSLTAGGILGGIGLWALAYWSDDRTRQHWQEVDVRISAFYAKLHEAKAEVTPGSAAAERIETVGYDFKTWATDFVTNQRPKKLQALPRTQLDEASLREITNLQCRPHLQSVCEMISEMCKAYNEVHEHKIQLDMTTLPVDITRPSDLGSLDFDDGNIWKFSCSMDYPFSAKSELRFRISLETSSDRFAHGSVDIRFIPASNQFYIDETVYGLAEDVTIKTKAGEKFDAAVTGMLKKLFEAQVLTRH
jgi:hypothetical protein